jgi:hypothetical protein
MVETTADEENYYRMREVCSTATCSRFFCWQVQTWGLDISTQASGNKLPPGTKIQPAQSRDKSLENHILHHGSGKT